MYNVPQKIPTNKRVELILLLVACAWVLLLIVNYVRYTQSKSLLLAIHVKDDTYEDGYVEEYISLGYIYRQYQRNSIAREEFVPFWVPKEKPEEESDLPKVETGYEVPENPHKNDKFRGLLYYYSLKREFLGTYKCLNSTTDCEKATSGYDTYNTLNKDPLTKVESPHILGNLYDRFAFIDDSKPQESKYGDPSYTRIIYLYQFLEGEEQILAKFADVKESTYDEDRGIGLGNNAKHIVKSFDNNKWGIINILESGTIEEILPYEYDSITYDEDTKFYILCKDDKWFIYDLNNKKIVSNETETPIYDVWRNTNLTYYYKTGKDVTENNKDFVEYSVYRIDGQEFLSGKNIIEIVERDNCLFYLTSHDNVLHFLDYSKEEKYRIQLAFSELEHTYLTNPAFEIHSETNSRIVFRVYEGRDKSYTYNTIYVNTEKWEYNQ